MSELESLSKPQETSTPAQASAGHIEILGVPVRVGRFAAWGALIFLLAILAFGLLRAQQGPARVGYAAPSFQITSFEGQSYNLQDLKGTVVLVNFWASWCKPCEQEAADLEAAWQYYKDRGDVLFLGVDYVDTEREAQAYLAKFNISYPNGPDLRTTISQSYHISGVPESYLIDQNGTLAYRLIGGFGSLDEIKAAIDPLLKPKQE
jgi:cytochrome c biogenesis protein CcmG/thiol:disulfide interchange protein DsbE